jgi:hypothetical protein
MATAISRLRSTILLHEGGRHSHAVFQADPRHRSQILHRQLRPQLSFPHWCWMLSGNYSTKAKRRDTQLTLRSKRRANSSSP